MSYSECLRSHQPIALSKGTQRSEGAYYRCLQKNDVKRRYAQDDQETFGLRVRPDQWRWEDDEEVGLSVSEVTCARTPYCAICFHPQPSLFQHAVRIDLAALSAAIDTALVAIFDPIGEPHQNPCHFIILPVDSSIDDLLVVLKEFMADDFPPGQKVPQSKDKLKQAEDAGERYTSVFTILRNVNAA